jgi:hypothetical protein
MAEIKYDTRHHAGATPEARIANRLRNSGGEEADVTTKTGDSARRTFHNIHHTGNVMQRGEDHPGEGNIFGEKRAPANPHGEIK